MSLSALSLRSRVLAISLAWCCLLCVAGGAACSSSSTATPDGGLGGPVSAALDDHCAGETPIVISEASCHPAADPGAADAGAGGPVEEAPVRYNAAADDDDCKYHVSFASSGVRKNQAVTLSVKVNRLADQAPATGAGVRLEAFLVADDTHLAPGPSPQTTESPAGSGQYTLTPVKFDVSGRWVVRFHLYEDCDDAPPDSPHGHVAFYFDVP